MQASSPTATDSTIPCTEEEEEDDEEEEGEQESQATEDVHVRSHISMVY